MKLVMIMHITCEECGNEHSIPMDYEEDQFCECGEFLAGISDDE